jgi:class 3 adenylate cyclase
MLAPAVDHLGRPAQIYVHVAVIPMGADEVGTLEALKANRREVVDPAIAEHKGRIVKTTGDGILVEFASAVDAVTCAIAISREDSGAQRERCRAAN